MVTIEIICNVESLYNWLSTKKLSDGNDVVFIDGFDGNEGACCTILSKDGQHAIYHGESTKFVKPMDKCSISNQLFYCYCNRRRTEHFEKMVK